MHWTATALLIALLGVASCKKESTADRSRSQAPVPASSDPTGADLVVGAIVAATEKSGGIRIYKIIEVNWFPKPVGEELVMIAYDEKAKTFLEAAAMWARGGLSIAHPKVRVQKHMFMPRDHRVIAHAAVTPADLSASVRPPRPRPPQPSTSP